MKPLRISAARVLCLVVWQIGFAPKAISANVNHLVPVSETAAETYQAKLHAQLSVTPADIAQMIVGPAWEPEFAVSVYSDLPTSNDDIVRYHVTVTRAATSIWYSPGAVQIRRSDAELPASAALPIREVWKQMLLSARPYKNPVDLPVDGETVEFALLEPNRSALRGELPVNPAGDILALQNLGTLLVEYGQATASEQKTLANKIEKTAKRLLKRKPDLDVVRLQDSLRISPRERQQLKQKANEGDPKAAERLSLYYSIYRSDRKMAVYYLKLGAKNNSDVAVRNLMTLYSTDALLFDFRKALSFRQKLKKIAETQAISLKSDADWGYERFLDHWRAGEKRRGLFFLEYAAQHGAESAPRELVGLYSKDPDLRNPKKAYYWKRRSDASNLEPDAL